MQSPFPSQCLCPSSVKCCWNSHRDRNFLLQFQGISLPRDTELQNSWLQVDLSVPAALWHLPGIPPRGLGCACASGPVWNPWIRWLLGGGQGQEEQELPWLGSVSRDGKLQGAQLRNCFSHPTSNQLLLEYRPTLGLRWKMCLIGKPFFFLIFFSCLMHIFVFKRTKPLTC